MERFERIQLGGALAETSLPGLGATHGCFERCPRQPILPALLSRQDDGVQLKIEIKPTVPDEEL